jgi:hypothetical protein
MVTVPSILPSPDIDDFGMAVEIATTWLQENWQIMETPGWQNVLLFMKASKTQATQNAMKMQAQAAAALPPPPSAGSGPQTHHALPPPGAGPGPQPGSMPAQ